MASGSDPKQSDEPDRARAGDTDEPDPGSTVSISVDELPDASVGVDDLPDAGEVPELRRLATVQPADPDDALPTLPAAAAAPPSTSGSTDGESTPSPAASSSGSVEVSLSSPTLAASSSGSVEVSLSSPTLAASSSGSVDVSLSSSTAIPQALPASDSQRVEVESQPVVQSGAVAAVSPDEGTGPLGRGKRVTAGIQEAISGGVEVLGASIGTIGEGVSKLGDVTKRVPLVGASVGRLGEGLTKAGESIHALPRVAQTRRGRLLVRSVIVGFSIVFAWIAAIVGFQLRAHDTPDFRPLAERMLVELGKGRAAIAHAYDQASPRFHEIADKERFIDDMMDMFATNGAFLEITAINDTLVTRGPTGKVGRVGLTAAFEKGIARGSISFHWDAGHWKLLGIGMELPKDVQITQTERQKRVAACIDDKGRDVSDQRRKCDVRDAAETILEMIRDGRAGEVWDAANDVFKQHQSRTQFIQLQEVVKTAVGSYERLLTVTDARAIGGMSATFDVVAEFERASGVRVEFDFTRPSKYERWRLARFKVTLPMPRPGDAPAETSLAPPPPSPPPSPP